MKLKVAVLAICMLVTGSLNTIATKLQDNVVVGQDESGQAVRFKHPAFQTAAMFLGEALCLLPYAVRRWYKHATRAAPLSEEEVSARGHRLRRSFAVFSLPAMCDAGATTMLNLGLFYTYASVFQMLRGTLVIFAGLLTVVLLHRRLHSHHWLGIVLIGAGAALVGASSVVYDRAQARHALPPPPGNLRALQQLGWQAAQLQAADAMQPPHTGTTGGPRRLLVLEGLWLRGDNATESGGGTAPNPLLGNVLVVLAQLLAATQFIVEEKFLVKYRAPVLLAVGLEGFWGLALCCLALPTLQHLPGPGGQPLDSIAQAWAEVRGDPTLQWTTAATILSIGLFNFFGVSVTKNLSGAARATIDACRTLFIWLFALRVGWEHFHMLQVVGFIVLLSGTSIYNEILRTCLPPAEPRRRRHHGLRIGVSQDAESGTVVQPLLAAGIESAEEAAAGARAAPKADDIGMALGGGSSVRFAQEVGASRPIAAGRHSGAGGGTAGRYTMARSVTILPAALSPHSLASTPSLTFGGASFAFSVPHNLSTGSGLGGTDAATTTDYLAEEEGEGEECGSSGSATSSEAWESGTDGGGASSRDPSQHGPPLPHHQHHPTSPPPSPCAMPPGRHAAGGGGAAGNASASGSWQHKGQ